MNDVYLIHRYRCLNCEDIDLCSTCYTGGVTPSASIHGDHTDQHQLVHLMYVTQREGSVSRWDHTMERGHWGNSSRRHRAPLSVSEHRGTTTLQNGIIWRTSDRNGAKWGILRESYELM